MTNKALWDAVITDMRERDVVGTERYTQPLIINTQKDFLQEHYEELLDACVYIKGEILRRKQNEL